MSSAVACHEFIELPPITDDGPAALLNGRYVIRERIADRGGVSRFLADDVSFNPPTTVQVVRSPHSESDVPADGSVWPSLAWEERVRETCTHDSMPHVLGRITSQDANYLVLEMPHGPHLWDAWDDAGISLSEKYGWLIQIAELLDELHDAGAILEGLRPDQVIVSENGRVVLVDPGALLPLPLPASAAVVRNLSTPPELTTGSWVDARADLYVFGALLQALIMGRELADVDFSEEGHPQPFLEQFPDCHPLLGRLMSKTFCADRSVRFPTTFAVLEDPTGFAELIATLQHCQNVLGQARLDVASWTSTGMTRNGNEDTFAVLHTSAGLADDSGDHALVLVADGMGGSAAGEVAASIAVHELYQALATLPTLGTFPIVDTNPPTTSNSVGSTIVAALKKANHAVHVAGQQGNGRRGMGCTAEAVYVDGRQVVIGHVGDSRTYRYRMGRLALMTRDHTYVNRLVEFGEITPEEAEAHPRRAELQQALGGWADVEPDVIEFPISPGDWVLVCSDGLSNIVKPPMIQQVLERASSADQAARRLVNLANSHGALDNVTVAIIRAV